jgi:hypothetical protein
MIRAHVLQEVRQMRFEELYGRRHRRELTMAEVPTPEAETAFFPWIGTHLTAILCVQEERAVAKGQYGAVAGHDPADPTPVP